MDCCLCDIQEQSIIYDLSRSGTLSHSCLQFSAQWFSISLFRESHDFLNYTMLEQTHLFQAQAHNTLHLFRLDEDFVDGTSFLAGVLPDRPYWPDLAATKPSIMNGKVAAHLHFFAMTSDMVWFANTRLEQETRPWQVSALQVDAPHQNDVVRKSSSSSSSSGKRRILEVDPTSQIASTCSPSGKCVGWWDFLVPMWMWEACFCSWFWYKI